MESTDQFSLQPAMPSGIGCALVFPAALFGTLMLADYSGPPEWWRALAEFVGWWSVCIAASIGCEALFTRFRAKRRPGRYRFLLAAIVVASGLLAITIAAVHPDTPWGVKLFYTTALQLLGVLGTLALLGFVGWFALNSRKS